MDLRAGDDRDSAAIGRETALAGRDGTAVTSEPFAYAAWRGIETRSGIAGVVASAG